MVVKTYRLQIFLHRHLLVDSMHILYSLGCGPEHQKAVDKNAGKEDQNNDNNNDNVFQGNRFYPIFRTVPSLTIRYGFYVTDREESKKVKTDFRRLPKYALSDPSLYGQVSHRCWPGLAGSQAAGLRCRQYKSHARRDSQH